MGRDFPKGSPCLGNIGTLNANSAAPRTRVGLETGQQDVRDLPHLGHLPKFSSKMGKEHDMEGETLSQRFPAENSTPVW